MLERKRSLQIIRSIEVGFSYTCVCVEFEFSTSVYNNKTLNLKTVMYCALRMLWVINNKIYIPETSCSNLNAYCKNFKKMFLNIRFNTCWIQVAFIFLLKNFHTVKTPSQLITQHFTIYDQIMLALILNSNIHVLNK